MFSRDDSKSEAEFHCECQEGSSNFTVVLMTANFFAIRRYARFSDVHLTGPLTSETPHFSAIET